MATGFLKFFKGLNLVPKSPSTVDSMGDMDVDSSNGKVNYNNGDTSSPFLTEAHTADVVNKSMDGNYNTFTNIPGSAISNNIPRSSLAAGSNSYVVINNASTGRLSEEATLAVTRGGSGAATLTGYVKGNGTSAFTAVASISRSDVAAGTAAHVVINDGSGNLSSEAQLAQSRGGTAFGTYTKGDVLYASATNTLSKLSIGSNGAVLKVNTDVPYWGSPSQAGVIVSVSAAYVVMTNEDIIFANATSAGFTVTLPEAGTNTGKIITIKKTDSTFNQVTITDAGFSSISIKLNTLDEAAEIIDTGSIWTPLARYIPSYWSSYTPNITGAGTESAVDFEYNRQGPYLYVSGTFTTGTVGTTGGIKVPLPTGLTVDSTVYTANRMVGKVIPAAMQNADDDITVIIDFSNSDFSNFSMGEASANSGLVVVANGSSFLPNTTSVSMWAKVPITGWNS